MTRPDRTRLVGLVVCIGLAILVSSAGPAATTAQFVDTETGQATLNAGTGFSTTPPCKCAWNDWDGDGIYDSDEPTFTDTDLESGYDNTSANLIIPGDVGKIDPKNGPLTIRAASIQSAVEIRTKTAGLTLEATSGPLDVSQNRLRAKNGDITVRADGRINITGTRVEAQNGVISIRGEGVTADSATVETGSGPVILSGQYGTGGSLEATGVSITADTNDIILRSQGDMILDSATLTATAYEITADLGTTSATLHVQGTTINDDDGVLTYDPDGASVDPNRSDVQP